MLTVPLKSKKANRGADFGMEQPDCWQTQTTPPNDRKADSSN